MVVTKNNLLSEIGSDIAADFVDSVADSDPSGIAKEAAPSLQLLRVLCPSHISRGDLLTGTAGLRFRQGNTNHSY